MLICGYGCSTPLIGYSWLRKKHEDVEKYLIINTIICGHNAVPPPKKKNARPDG